MDMRAELFKRHSIALSHLVILSLVGHIHLPFVGLCVVVKSSDPALALRASCEGLKWVPDSYLRVMRTGKVSCWLFICSLPLQLLRLALSYCLFMTQ